MLRKVEKYIRKVFWLPFIIGFIGYYFWNGGVNGEILNLAEALYASAALYFVNPVADNSNALILTAKIMALIVTTEFVLASLSSALETAFHWLTNLFGSSTAVYTDTLYGEHLVKNLKHGYIGKSFPSEKEENAKDHIIMFSDDSKNLDFYEKHRETFKKRHSRVFMALNSIDTSLLSETMSKNVSCFCIDELMAREYWKEYDLYDEIAGHPDRSEAYKIAVIGYDSIGKALFKQGFLNNIYAVGQKIEYHIWGCSVLDRDFLENLKTDNGDWIVVHGEDYRDDMKQILEMDRVIVTHDILAVAQELIRQNGRYKIYCYSEAGEDFSSLFSSDKIYVFGNVSDLLTEENIKSEKLYLQAKLFHYDYFMRREKRDDGELDKNYETEMELEWRNLDGFKKGSNIFRADYYWIEDKNRKNNVPEENLWEMEHIRWCRYHYYNRWSHGEEKDAEKRTHPLLVLFSELPPDVKKKDGIYNSKLKEKIESLMKV